MRDPTRIRPFLDRLAEVWEKTPEFRFGQFLVNIQRFWDEPKDIWLLEEKHWLDVINKWDEALRPVDGWDN